MDHHHHQDMAGRRDLTIQVDHRHLVDRRHQVDCRRQVDHRHLVDHRHQVDHRRLVDHRRRQEDLQLPTEEPLVQRRRNQALEKQLLVHRKRLLLLPQAAQGWLLAHRNLHNHNRNRNQTKRQ